jgi:hypothetical protein
MIRVSVSLLFVVFLTASCSTPGTAPEGRFSEQERADFIVRYYTDDTSYVLKPQRRDGPFLTVLNKEGVLDVARQQPNRGLAVVVLIHYGLESQAEAVKREWMSRLTGVGYQRVVFLCAAGNMKVNGLPVLASGG